MKRMSAIAIVAMACIAAMPAISRAAGARITWQQSGEVDHFRLFITQPDVADLAVTSLDVMGPDVIGDSTFAIDVHGLDPLSATYLLMVSVGGDGSTSDTSNMLSMEPTDFCPAFDADQDGKVTVADALLLTRDAVGLGGDTSGDATVLSALDALRIATALICG